MGFEDSAGQMLEAAYQDLGFAQGDLLVAGKSPDGDTPSAEWIERGGWLSTASEAHAERVLFVDGNPVVVFAKHEGDDPGTLRRLINRIWCMARPRLLFLATPGELRVFDLAVGPIDIADESCFLHNDRVLELAQGVRAVQRQLRAYNREQVESGKLFEERRFAKARNRADEALLRDLRTLRTGLMDVPSDSSESVFTLKHAHALIGRSIFIRYLEDRGVLLQEHFEEIASRCADWRRGLDEPYEKVTLKPEMEGKLYPKVLSDKDFTYALFDWLADQFNGDMFPRDVTEQQAVTGRHLDLLRRFLLGDLEDQGKFFFYAYDFEVIPIELISSIYEEFYTSEVGDSADRGTHYTPSTLVEFILSRTLTPAMLAQNPRVLDPACGSGIFLVEAFRRIVRHRVWSQAGRPLGAQELREILRDQIAGIEINPEAMRIAAFSLYLALLDYQDPSNIRAHPRLPNLLYDDVAHPDRSERYGILLTANAFNLGPFLLHADARVRFGAASTDVVVGNPPWGFPKKQDREMTAAATLALGWCARRNLAVGDNELSQAFIHRCVDFLRDGGTAGMLVSSGILFKTHENTQRFRRQWLKATTLEHIVNFAHVRSVFFSRGVAPFVSVVFRKGRAENPRPFEYWSAKKTALVARLRAPVLSRVDLRLLTQDEVRQWDALWKIHWFGGHLDEALIRKLQMEVPLRRLQLSGEPAVVDYGRGYEDFPGGAQTPSGMLRDYRELWTEDLERYGPLDLSRQNRVRATVYRTGKVDAYKRPTLYDGIRLLFRRGVPRGTQDKGDTVTTLAFDPFCFRNSVHAIRLRDDLEEEAKVLVAICWSSLMRYYLFLTVGSWGLWHDELQLEEHIMKLPVRLPTDGSLRSRMIAMVDELLSIDRLEGCWSGRVRELEKRLDEAVFDLYELTETDRDLVGDMCNTGLDLFYNHARSSAVQPIEPTVGQGATYGVHADLPSRHPASVSMSGYLDAFLSVWNRELEPDGEFRWHILGARRSSPMVGVLFSTQYKHQPLPPPDCDSGAEWSQILRDLGEDSVQHYGSRGVFTDGLVRSVSERQILIIKRNEQRLWTRSMAREDAEATIAQAIRRQEMAEGVTDESA